MVVVHMFSGHVDKVLYSFTNHKRLAKEDISFKNKQTNTTFTLYIPTTAL
jgi:hypothetical protein